MKYSGSQVFLGLWILASIVYGCSKTPSRFDYYKKSLGYTRRYAGTNVLSAEVALLDWEKYAVECQKLGVKGIVFDTEFAVIYARLSLVYAKLGREELVTLERVLNIGVCRTLSICAISRRKKSRIRFGFTWTKI